MSNIIGFLNGTYITKRDLEFVRKMVEKYTDIIAECEQNIAETDGRERGAWRRKRTRAKTDLKCHTATLELYDMAIQNYPKHINWTGRRGYKNGQLIIEDISN